MPPKSLGSETDVNPAPPSTSGRRLRLRLLIALLATGALLAAPAWLWMRSLVPSTYSIMSMGYVDFGGGRADAAHGQHRGWEAPPPQPGDVSVTDLVEQRTGPADVTVTLAARAETFTLASGETVDGYTLNGTSPGPEIRATQGDVLEVKMTMSQGPTGERALAGVDVPSRGRRFVRHAYRSSRANGTCIASSSRTPVRTGITRTRLVTFRCSTGYSVR